MQKEKIINSIYKILDSYRKNPYNEIFSSKKIIQKIEYFVDKNEPIRFIFPGFHGKVNNKNFVLGQSLDMGDYVGLQHIVGMCNKIKSIYKPGVEFIVVHEGHFYQGKTPLTSSKEALDTYLKDFRKLIKPYPFIKSYSVYEMIPYKTLEASLEYFWENYAPNDEELPNMIKQASYLVVYQAYKKIHAIYVHDHEADFPTTHSQQKKQIKAMALKQMQVYFGFGKLVKDFFNELPFIRLSSLYKDPSFDECVSINYLPNKNHLSTPTFNCLVEYKNHSYDFIKKYVAEQRNYILTEKNGLKYYKEAA